MTLHVGEWFPLRRLIIVGADRTGHALRPLPITLEVEATNSPLGSTFVRHDFGRTSNTDSDGQVSVSCSYNLRRHIGRRFHPGRRQAAMMEPEMRLWIAPLCGSEPGERRGWTATRADNAIRDRRSRSLPGAPGRPLPSPSVRSSGSRWYSASPVMTPPLRAGGIRLQFGNCRTFDTTLPRQHGSVRRSGSSAIGLGHRASVTSNSTQSWHRRLMNAANFSEPSRT